MEIAFARIVMNQKIKMRELGAFRNSVVEIVGRDKIDFHNHKGDEEFVYSYPCIQYQQQKGKASILFLGEDKVKQAQYLVGNHSKWEMDVQGEKRSFGIDALFLNRFEFDFVPEEEMVLYRMRNYAFGSEEDELDFLNSRDIVERAEMLKKGIANSILYFAHSIGWKIPTDRQGRFEIGIRGFSERSLFYKRKRLGIDVEFYTNLRLLRGMGLGKGVSHGFGVISEVQRSEKRKS